MAVSQHLSMLATPRGRVQYGTLALRPTPEVEGQLYYAYDVNDGEGALYVADGTGDTDWREVGAQDNQINIPVGLESALPGTPDGIGAVYYATDTRRLYVSPNGSAWVNVALGLTAVKGTIISSGSDGKLYATPAGTDGQIVGYNSAMDGGIEPIDIPTPSNTIIVHENDHYYEIPGGVGGPATAIVFPNERIEEIAPGVFEYTEPDLSHVVRDESSTISVDRTFVWVFPDGWVDDVNEVDGIAHIAPPAGTIAGTVIVEEEDGTPTGSFEKIIFPNGTLTDNADGSVTYSPDIPTPTILVREVDGTPSAQFDEIIFPNGTLTDNADGSVTYTPPSSSSATIPTWKWRKTALQNIINGSFNDVIFPTQVFGDSGITYSAGVFTIVNTGMYEVNYSLECDMVNVGSPVSLEFDSYFVGSIFHRNFAVFPADSTRVTVMANFKYEVTAANTSFKISAQGGITSGDELNIYYVNGAALTAWVEFKKLS